MRKLKVGDRVRTKENHKYIQVLAQHIGTIVNVDSVNESTTVKFKHTQIIFCSDELKKVRKKK